MVDIELHNPDLYINRELSVLQFIYRVLACAKDESAPILERLNFLFICAANLDEFYEVRVAGLKQQLVLDDLNLKDDFSDPKMLLQQIATVSHELVAEIYQVLNADLIPALFQENLHVLDIKDWNEQQIKWIKNYFHHEVLPVISPIGLDIAHPFPRLVNKSLNYIVSLSGKDAFGRDSGLAIVHAPRLLPRVIKFPEEICDLEGRSFVLLNSIIKAHARELFPGMIITGCYQFRVTRNSDLFLDEDNIDDLALALKKELISRRYGDAVRLEIAHDCPNVIAEFLLQKLGIDANVLFRVNGPVNLSRFRMLLDLINRPDLRYPTFTPGTPARLKLKQNIFDTIRQDDILIHHPYESFATVLDFIYQAALDSNVLAIKQTLYRTGADSPMVRALIDAARAGKQVTAVVELRARFDEAFNIELANRLQEAGALVVYGVVGFKTHAKMTLIVRREGRQLQSYVHLSTGNYHAITARSYTDFGLFTCDKNIGYDVQKIFQELTGIGRAARLKRLWHAPFTLAGNLIKMIKFETQEAIAGRPASIIIKMNALTERKLIRALYRASKAGVKITLLIRGICCLKPGLPNISENIEVYSIVGRFLEHARVYYFYHAGEELLYCSSADWMERNLYFRVEVAFPIQNKQLAKRIKEEALDNELSDNVNKWRLQSDGYYEKVNAHKRQQHCAQQKLIDKHKA